MYPSLTVVINEIQKSKMGKDIKVFCCKAVQEYFKTLNCAGALKRVKNHGKDK
jgi:hypothetical protein